MKYLIEYTTKAEPLKIKAITLPLVGGCTRDELPRELAWKASREIGQSITFLSYSYYSSADAAEQAARYLYPQDRDREQAAREAYREDCQRRPLYPCGTPRKQWEELAEIVKDTWRKDPWPRTWETTTKTANK